MTKVVHKGRTFLRKLSIGAAALAALAFAAPQAIVGEANAREVVNANVKRGTIVVRTSQRRLYYGIGRGKAIRYPVGVGRAGRTWTGSTRIRSKRLRPAWVPPKAILRDKPGMRRYYPGGSPSNPMGAAALLLGGEYAIHGTNRPESIGGFVSYGCIRMHNRDILDLYKRVSWGTKVIVKN